MVRRSDAAETPVFTTVPPPAGSDRIGYVKVGELRAEDDEETCLRPLGLCELGGSCDSCWYRPDHPRFRKQG